MVKVLVQGKRRNSRNPAAGGVMELRCPDQIRHHLKAISMRSTQIMSRRTEGVRPGLRMLQKLLAKSQHLQPRVVESTTCFQVPLKDGLHES